MIKKILTYSAGEVLIKGVSFIAIPFYSHLILPNEYGILGFLTSLVSFLPFIFTFYYMYAYVRFAVEEKPEKMLSTYVYLGLFLNSFYFISALIMYHFFIQQYHIVLKYYILAILSSSVIYLFQILQMHYRSKGNASAYIKLSVLYTLLGIGLNFLFLFLLKDNVFAMLLSGCITAFVVSLIALRAIHMYIDWRYVDLKLIKKILQYSIPLVPGAISLLLFSQADKIVLLNYVSKEELGIYALAFTLGLSMGYIGSAFFMSYQPIFYEKIKQGEIKAIEQQFWKNIIFLFLGLLLSFITIVIAYQVIDARYSKGIYISLLIALAYGFIAFSQMMELHLTYIKKTVTVSWIYAIGGISTIVLLMFLSPLYGIQGAALSLYFGGLIISVIMYTMAQQYLYIRYQYKTIVLSLFYMFMFGCGWAFI